MIVNPSLVISSLKIAILAILVVSVFFFKKSYVSERSTPLKTSETHRASIKKNSIKTIVQHNSGPFAIQVLGLLAALSTISLIISTRTKFQQNTEQNA